jgi:LysR family glycine cleavage system transcriptional activator
MNPDLPPLNPLRVFECVSRHMSFAGAAGELHITPSAVSHQIKALERWLGFELLDRDSRRMCLTPSGEAYAAVLGKAFARIVQGTRELVSNDSRQRLVVRGHTTFFLRWLIPRLSGFQTRFPDIKVRLEASVQAVDFRHDKADVAIVYGDGNGAWPGLQSHYLFGDALTPVMAPALAERLAAGRGGPEGLLALPLFHLSGRPGHWADWLAGAGLARGRKPRDIHYEDLSIIYQCAIEGLGVALGQLRYLEKELASGQLVAPHPFVLRRSRGYHLVWPEDRVQEFKILRFREWIASQAPVPQPG